MSGSRLLRWLALAPCMIALAVTHSTYACTVDGRPTAMANGHRDNVLGIAPTTASARTWARFSFPGTYHAGAVIRFAEDTAQLRRVLPHGWMQRPCRWEFGDSDRWTSGWTATHRYARPGIYRITVAAYVPAYRAYYPFDTVRIVVTR